MGRLTNFRFLALTGAVLTLAGSFTPARAQDPDDLKRGVARISLINGDISVRRGGDGAEWVAGVINAPLLTDDRIATGPNSRAEIQFDANNLLRLGANAELRLSQLEYGRYQMELTHGVMTYRMLRTSDGNIEIDTPSLSVRPSRQGSYRISVNEAGETEVTARNGDVEVFTPHGSQWVHNGQTLMARGAAADAEYQIVAAGPVDEWDRWCDNRDRMLMQSPSSRYVGPGVYGAEDLDAAGTWTSVPEYGNVWRPTAVSPDWAPYQSGRWVWEDWYGWTWVSYDPWGWAPYHYGRWFHHASFGWCWYPGLITARHYWSPALVGFFGFGGGGGIGFGFGSIGWVPLAPFEVFHPWWGRGYYGGGFNRNINITNVNITNVYRNAQYRNGISGVAAHDFQSGRFQNVIHPSATQVASAGMIRGQMPFAGGAANQRFADRPATVIPRGNQTARVFTHQQPNPVSRGQFNQGVAGNRPTTQQANPQSNRGQSTNSDAAGWRRFGSPSGQSGGQVNQPAVNRNGFGSTGQAQRQSASPPAAPRNDNRSGWQRFGTPAGGNSPSQRQAPAAPRQDYQASPRGQSPAYNSPSGGQGSLRISPPVVRERPSYSAPRQQSAPSYSAPRQSAPAPRSNGGGSATHGNSGGGSHASRGK